MKKEKSCGAVVYKIINKQLKILILKMQRGHYSMPKGHVEGNETEEETALREIKEETNLDVNIDTNFRRISTYSPYEGVLKDVIYFVAEAQSKNIIEQKIEVEHAYWMNPNDALNILTHPSDKNILEEAIIYVEEKKLNGGN